MLNKNKLNVAIIGAGNMGAFLDNPKSKDILTHAHAYKKHPGFELAGFVDIDTKKAEKASKIWGGLATRSIFELAKETQIDVVSVCAPDKAHCRILKEIKKLNILGGIIEKPLTTSIKDSQKIINSGFFKSRKFLVNYTRRFVPEFQDLKKKISIGKYGKFITGNGIYGKGFLHNGSHLIDLIRYLLGDIKSRKALSVIYDFNKKDPTVSLILKLDNGGEVLVNTMDSRVFTVFELDLYFEKARIRIIDGGSKIEEYVLGRDETFRGYKKVFLGRATRTSLNRAIYYTVENLYEAVVNDRQLICTIDDGFQAQKICTI